MAVAIAIALAVFSMAVFRPLAGRHPWQLMGFLAERMKDQSRTVQRIPQNLRDTLLGRFQPGLWPATRLKREPMFSATHQHHTTPHHATPHPCPGPIRCLPSRRQRHERQDASPQALFLEGLNWARPQLMLVRKHSLSSHEWTPVSGESPGQCTAQLDRQPARSL